MAELKVRCHVVFVVIRNPQPSRYLQNKLEAQYAAKRDAHVGEVADLKQQIEMKSNEIRGLNASIDSLKGVNEELKVRASQQFFCHTPLAHLNFSACVRGHLCRHRGREEPRRECPRSRANSQGYQRSARGVRWCEEVSHA